MTPQGDDQHSDSAGPDGRVHGERLSEELSGIFRLVREVAADQTWLAQAIADLPAGEHHTELGSSVCRSCPVCRVLAAVQRNRPEVTAHLEDAWDSLGAALIALSGEAPTSADSSEPGGPQRPDHAERDDADAPSVAGGAAFTSTSPGTDRASAAAASVEIEWISIEMADASEAIPEHEGGSGERTHRGR